MRIFAYFIKTFKENIRDWKILSLVIVFAPFFVFMMNAYLKGAGSGSYNVLVINSDSERTYSAELINEWKKQKAGDGRQVLSIAEVDDEAKAKKDIENKSADLLVFIPGDFSSSFGRYLKSKKGVISPLKSYGDSASGRYMMAAAFSDYITYTYIGERAGVKVPMNVEFEPAGTRGKQLTDFDIMVPALMVFSIIMVLFTAAATLVKEIEKGTIIRLILSKLSAFEFMTAVTINQLIIGGACLGLTFLSGYLIGYRTGGSVFLIILVGLAVTFAVIGISILTACFIKTMFGLLTVGCFPFFILMFFSDCMIPLPKIKILEVLGNPVFVNDILPTAIGVRAFNKIMNFNAGFGDIAFELSAILVLGAVYFAAGAWLFKKQHMGKR